MTRHSDNNGTQPTADSAPAHAQRIEALRTRRSVANISGEARNIAVRTEAGEQVLSFQIERYEQGTRMQPVGVEFRTLTLNGMITDGDNVTANGTWVDGFLRATNIVNHTKGNAVMNRRSTPLFIVLIAIGIFAGGFAIWGFLAIQWFSGH